MSKSYPLEALLRPPVEFWSAFVAGMGGILSLAAPSLFMLTPALAYGFAAVLFAWSAYRFYEGWYIIRYQHNLHHLPAYELTSDEIPMSRNRLFLGKGFRWTQRHTQRLRDLLRPHVQHYVQPPKWYTWARAKEQEWEHTPILKSIAKLMGRNAWWNPVAPLPPVGGSSLVHAVEMNEQDIWLNLGERVGHTLVLGTTRVGKTRLAEVLVSQDIRRGEVVILFDPKGDADLLKRMYAECKRCGRENDFYMFHLGYPEVSARYNAVGNFSRISEVATRIANQLPGEGESAAFRDFAWRFVNIVAKALVALGRRPDYVQLGQHMTNIEPLLHDYCRVWLPTVDPNWELTVKKYEMAVNDRNVPINMKGRSALSVALMRYIKEKALFDPVADGLRAAFEYEKNYFDKLVVTLMPLMEKLTTGKSSELISPNYFDLDDPRPIFDWMQVIRKKGVVYVGLDALSDTMVASAVGNSMFADLVSIAGQIYKFGTGHGLHDEAETRSKMPSICIHADEFNELIGNEFIPLVNKAGGAGIQVTAYTQTWSDIEARVGSASKAGQVTGNFNTLIMLRVRETATAELLTKQLPKVEVSSLTAVTGASDAGDRDGILGFSTNNEDRLSVQEVEMLGTNDLITLPKGQAFALLEGGRLYKIRLPLPKTGPRDQIPATVELVSQDMRKKYETDSRWSLSATEKGKIAERPHGAIPWQPMQ